MRTLLPLVFLLFSVSLQAQTYSRAKIFFDAEHGIAQLAEMGLEIDHGRHQPHRYFVSDFADFEIEAILAAGFSTEILVADLQAELLERNAHFLEHGHDHGQATVFRNSFCDDEPITEYETPENYADGSMGGYFTYQEMLDNLDEMAAQYPDIFKARQPITADYTTHDGNTLYWVKISDEPEVEDATEPEVLYTALHHAREPNSLSQMIFYMWYLLENYETDAEVKYLVDNMEMYFIPCVNPDGYLYNELTNPDGGGFWRKNRNDNGGGSFGVDLNRNYAYQWGELGGSSGNPDSEVYRGPSAASEPETQMMEEFCEAHEFSIALNYHTFGNLLIYPWSYTDGSTPDHESFTVMSEFMVGDNEFLAGFPSQTVGYTVNGSSDDWMYGEQTTKEKIYSMTPEVGFGFWPTQGQIDDLNKSCMKMNLRTAHLPLNIGTLRPANDGFVSTLDGEVGFNLKKIGLADGGLEVSLEAVSANVESVGDAVNFDLVHLEDANGVIPFTLSPDITEGELVQFNLVLDNGLYQWREAVEMVFTDNNSTAFAEPGDDISQWPGTDWSPTTEQFFSAPSSLTDSEGGNYAPNDLNLIILDNAIDIEDAVSVRLNFWARWDIEEDEDYAQLRAIVNGVEFPLCGKYSEFGTDEQDFGQPVYDGTQLNWVQEEIDLTEYLVNGGNISLGFVFQMVSDEMVEKDGFYFDDLTVTVVKEEEEPSSTFRLTADQFTVTSRPNPAGHHIIFDIAEGDELLDGLNLQVFNALGQMVASQKVKGKVLRMETNDWTPGVYHYRFSDGEMAIPAGRFLVGR